MKRVLILGAGGHAQVVADILLAMYTSGNPIKIIGFLDDRSDRQKQQLLGFPVLGPLKARYSIPHDFLVVAIGDNRTRSRLHQTLRKERADFIVVCHPRAVLSPDVQIGDGSMIAAGVVVNTGTIIDEGVILNTGCTIDHHNRIGRFAHIAPGVHLAGEVEVGEGALIGIGAAVIPGVKIGPWSVVGAGAVVTRDVPPNTTVVGVPARPLS